jgi:hypothetical protein
METPNWKSATEDQVYAIRMRIMPVTNALMYKTPPRPDPNALFVAAMSRDILLEGQMATKKRNHTPVPILGTSQRMPSTKYNAPKTRAEERRYKKGEQ